VLPNGAVCGLLQGLRKKQALSGGKCGTYLPPITHIMCTFLTLMCTLLTLMFTYFDNVYMSLLPSHYSYYTAGRLQFTRPHVYYS
jgi:hypothetical protein